MAKRKQKEPNMDKSKQMDLVRGAAALGMRNREESTKMDAFLCIFHPKMSAKEREKVILARKK